MHLGDNTLDWLVGAYGDDDTFTDAGAAYVIFTLDVRPGQLLDPSISCNRRAWSARFESIS